LYGSSLEYFQEISGVNSMGLPSNSLINNSLILLALCMDAVRIIHGSRSLLVYLSQFSGSMGSHVFNT
jgi:hypothetical protein